MAVKYVSDFSFPSEFGFHKPSSNSGKGVAKGMSGFSKGRAGPSVVGKTGAGKFHSGAVPKFAHGGLARVPAVGKGGSEDRGIGKTAEHFQKVSDKRSPAATRSEKSSGVQKPAFKSGGHATTPMRYKEGGSTLHASGCKCNYCSGGVMKKKAGGSIKVASQPVKMGEKTSWNKDDATSPGSFKRTPPGEKVANKKAAYSKFDGEGRDTEPATKQSGEVERMSGWSDFKKGGKVKKYAAGGQVKTEDRYETGDHGQHIPAPDKQERGDGMEYAHGGSVHPKLKNLGQYAHGKKSGGTVKATRSETASGHASQSPQVVNSSPKGRDEQYEREAGTPGQSNPGGDYHEIKSGSAAAMGGFARGNSHKKNAAIHAKADHKAMGAMGALAGALSQPQPGAAPPMGGPPPGAPPMGGPPPGAPPMGRPMGPPPGAAPMGRPMGGPPMGGGMPTGGAPAGVPHMSEGGGMHVFHHHIQH